MTDKTLSIYVHIPFCISKCAYCSFYSEKYNRDDASKYISAIVKNIEFFSRQNKMEVDTIYFGGGTPTVLESEMLCKVLNSIKNSYVLRKDCEITFEANPKTVDHLTAFSLRECGFNRVSLGIQTTDNKRLKNLGRIHTWEDGMDAFNILKQTGFSNISVDLMYALPNETKEDIKEDIKKILSLSPSHISAYALSLEDGTPLFQKKNLFFFPDEDEQLDMYLYICKELRNAGYDHYEISNFAKQGFESKHNSGYWNRKDYIGFGAGAHSFYEGKRFFVMPCKQKFIENTEKEDFYASLGFNESFFVSQDEIAEEEIMLSLRTSRGIKISSLTNSLKQFVDNGFAKHENGIFTLTDKGFFVSNNIIYHACKELLYDTK